MPLTTELAERGLDLLLNSGLEALSIGASPAADAQALPRPPDVVFFQAQTSLRDALARLASNRILSAPVLATSEDVPASADEGSSAEYHFLGFCDVAAILNYLLASLPPELLKDSPDVSAENTVRLMDTLSALAAGVLAAPVSALPRKDDGDIVSRNFASSSLLDVVQAAFIHPVHLRVAVCHRIAAADVRPELDAGASMRSVDPRSMSVVAHADIIRFLHAHVDDLGALADASVESLSLAGPDLFVFFVSSQLSALRTLVELDEHSLSAAGVVNSAGELVANVSVSDLRNVPADKLGILALPVLEFLALQAGCRRPRAPVTMSPGSPLRDVLAHMVADDVHHIYVISDDESRRPVAVITPVDILYLFDSRPAARIEAEAGHSRFMKDA